MGKLLGFRGRRDGNLSTLSAIPPADQNQLLCIGLAWEDGAESMRGHTMAELKDRLRADMIASMKAKEADTTKVLRAVLAAITTEEVSGEAAHELTAEQELAVVTKQVRQRRDSAEAYAAGNRQDLAATELAEAEILQVYLPQQLSDDELHSLVEDEVAAVGGEVTMKQMGQIIKAVNAKASGRADGGRVAAAVKARLQRG